ncbi:hypothetical protein BDA99DRAFT_494023 [Phascolomyces articulosus]|uniref:Protein kinase domain-containing protein n=1 Tax=Phascolomyces articulosus TaxID=60185 RepID=A0AAD5KNX7_9FUNG|nr:hypothetical protein BDA99DRAFT_494023 [Phascolomyces articulosus]
MNSTQLSSSNQQPKNGYTHPYGTSSSSSTSVLDVVSAVDRSMHYYSAALTANHKQLDDDENSSSSSSDDTQHSQNWVNRNKNKVPKPMTTTATTTLEQNSRTITQRPPLNNYSGVNKNLDKGKEAIVLKDEPKKRTPVMVTPESTLSSDLSCSSSIELIENTKFPYIEGTPDELLQEPLVIPTIDPGVGTSVGGETGGKAENNVEALRIRKGFRPFVRVNSMSSSIGSVATVTMKTVRQQKRKKGGLHCLTVDLKKTYENFDPDFGYTGQSNPRRVLTRPSKPAKNDGYDNENEDYIIRVHDVLGNVGKNQYRIIDLLGSGTFGQVVKCENTTTHELVSVKIIKNNKLYRRQSEMEADILKRLHEKLGSQGQEYILKMHTTFNHKSHLCIVSELLSYSLLDVLQQNSHGGIPIHLVRSISIRLIETLVLLKEAQFIHCDLKPENILLKSVDSVEIKVVDFGASCHVNSKQKYPYVQSRFYRAPEVILGIPYGYPIDMWSAGCVIGEMFLGLPLFPGTTEHNQLRRIIDMLGAIPPEMLHKGGIKTDVFYHRKTVVDPPQPIDKDSDNNSKNKNDSTKNNNSNNNTRPTLFRMKSQEEYCREQKKPDVPNRRYFPEMGLTDLILNYTNTFIQQHQNKEQELELRHSLADFLKGLLTIDPETRWTPNQAREHPFISGKPFLKPYVPVKEINTQNNKCTSQQRQQQQHQQSNTIASSVTSSSATTVTVNGKDGKLTHSNMLLNNNNNQMNGNRLTTASLISATIAEKQQQQQQQQQQQPVKKQQEPLQQQQKQQRSNTFPSAASAASKYVQQQLEKASLTKRRSLLFNNHQRKASQVHPPVGEDNTTKINFINSKLNITHTNNNNTTANTNINNNLTKNNSVRNIIYMPPATTNTSTPTSPSSNTSTTVSSPLSNNKNNPFLATASSTTTTNTTIPNPILFEKLQKHYKHDGSPAGAVLLTSPPIVDAMIANNTAAITKATTTTSILTNPSNNNSTTSIIMNANGISNYNNNKNRHSETDVSKRVKIAPYIKLRRGSHDSFRMPDEIHCHYRGATDVESSSTSTTKGRDLFFQHNNSSQVKLNDHSFLDENSNTSGEETTSEDIMSNHHGLMKRNSKHAGEAAGGLFMMNRKQK